MIHDDGGGRLDVVTQTQRLRFVTSNDKKVTD